MRQLRPRLDSLMAWPILSGGSLVGRQRTNRPLMESPAPVFFDSLLVGAPVGSGSQHHEASVSVL